MRCRAGLLAMLLALSLAPSGYAQVDCGAGGALCATIKYGLGLSPDYRKDEVPPDSYRYTNAFFGPDLGGVSYFSSRSDLTGAPGNCGPQRSHAPLPGQLLLREQTDCEPTSTGPTCTGGERSGAPCHLPTLNQGCTGAGVPLSCCRGPASGTCLGDEVCTGAGTPLGCCSAAGAGSCPPFQTSAANEIECGPGGQCAMAAGSGCRVEIPTSDGGVSPAAETSEVRISTLAYNAPAPNGDTFSLSSSTGNTLGGTSDDQNPLCLDTNVRRRASTGTRYRLHSSRGGDGAKTYLRWDSAAGVPESERDDFASSFRLHTDDSTVCCAAGNPVLGTCCPAVNPGICSNYPLLSQGNCGQPFRFVNEDNVQPDLIFASGRGSAFYTDPEFVLPGQIAGICRSHRSVACFAPAANASCNSNRNPYACCTGAGTGTCDEDCSGFDADPAAPGLQPDRCDFRTPGYRAQAGACARDGNNDSRAACCGVSIYVLRGTPAAQCSLITRYPYSGDPGPDCGLPNYGADHRDDANCDGVADFPDRCPFHSEWDQDRDSDGDCSAPGGACRGDECECGDQAGSGVLSGTVELGNGVVDVADLVGINAAIFGSRVRRRLCDTTGDSLCTVSDIVGANREIFDPDSSLCRHLTPRPCFAGVPAPCCGNALLEPGEFCDDGNLGSGDGCNGACRVE